MSIPMEWRPDWRRRALASAALGMALEAVTMAAPTLAAQLTPPVRELTPARGRLALRGKALPLALPAGPEHEACRTVLSAALEAAGLAAQPVTQEAPGNSFRLGAGASLPPLPEAGCTEEGYVLAVSRQGIAAAGASPRALLYAAQTLRQVEERQPRDEDLAWARDLIEEILGMGGAGD